MNATKYLTDTKDTHKSDLLPRGTQLPFSGCIAFLGFGTGLLKGSGVGDPALWIGHKKASKRSGNFPATYDDA